MREEDFIKRLASLHRQGADVVAGPGDDCAVLDFGLDELILAAADQMVSSVHFLESSTSPAAVAKKLFNRNLSDIAAMGGRPTHALVTLAISPFSLEWLDEFQLSLQMNAESRAVSVIGGDISSLGSMHGQACSLTILGRIAKDSLCLRSGASCGDLLYATGTFGNSFASGWHLNFAPRLEEGAFLAGRFAKAMMDVSDGLLKDAERLAAASGISLTIDTASIPLRKGASTESALSDGEDYELLFAVPPALEAELLTSWLFPTPITRIGSFTKGITGKAFNLDGSALSSPSKHGYDHFNGKDYKDKV